MGNLVVIDVAERTQTPEGLSNDHLYPAVEPELESFDEPDSLQPTPVTLSLDEQTAKVTDKLLANELALEGSRARRYNSYLSGERANRRPQKVCDDAWARAVEQAEAEKDTYQDAESIRWEEVYVSRRKHWTDQREADLAALERTNKAAIKADATQLSAAQIELRFMRGTRPILPMLQLLDRLEQDIPSGAAERAVRYQQAVSEMQQRYNGERIFEEARAETNDIMRRDPPFDEIIRMGSDGQGEMLRNFPSEYLQPLADKLEGLGDILATDWQIVRGGLAGAVHALRQPPAARQNIRRHQGATQPEAPSLPTAAEAAMIRQEYQAAFEPLQSTLLAGGNNQLAAYGQAHEAAIRRLLVNHPRDRVAAVLSNTGPYLY